MVVAVRATTPAAPAARVRYENCQEGNREGLPARIASAAGIFVPVVFVEIRLQPMSRQGFPGDLSDFGRTRMVHQGNQNKTDNHQQQPRAVLSEAH